MRSLRSLFSGRALWQKGWDIYVSLGEEDEGYRDMRFVYVGGAVKRRNDPLTRVPREHGCALSSNLTIARMFSLDPVRADTFGRVAVESMACGTPVVTTPSPSHRELNLPFVFRKFFGRLCGVVFGTLGRLWEAGSPYQSTLTADVQAPRTPFDFKNTVTQYEKMFFEVLHAN